MKNPNYSTGN